MDTIECCLSFLERDNRIGVLQTHMVCLEIERLAGMLDCWCSNDGLLSDYLCWRALPLSDILIFFGHTPGLK